MAIPPDATLAAWASQYTGWYVDPGLTQGAPEYMWNNPWYYGGDALTKWYMSEAGYVYAAWWAINIAHDPGVQMPPPDVQGWTGLNPGQQPGPPPPATQPFAPIAPAGPPLHPPYIPAIPIPPDATLAQWAYQYKDWYIDPALTQNAPDYMWNNPWYVGGNALTQWYTSQAGYVYAAWYQQSVNHVPAKMPPPDFEVWGNVSPPPSAKPPYTKLMPMPAPSAIKLYAILYPPPGPNPPDPYAPYAPNSWLNPWYYGGAADTEWTKTIGPNYLRWFNNLPPGPGGGDALPGYITPGVDLIEVYEGTTIAGIALTKSLVFTPLMEYAAAAKKDGAAAALGAGLGMAAALLT